MNKELLLESIKERQIARKKKAETDKDKNAKEFSWVSYFAGEDYNELLTQKQELQEKIGDNIVDFGQLGNEKADFVERRIREIHNNDKNKQLIKNNEFPIILFKNIEKIKRGSSLENSLLPIFDAQQNTKLFGSDLDLSKYILIVTSSTRDMGKLSLPLTSRLDCVNVKTAELRNFFLNKHYGWILFGSIFLMIIFLIMIFWPSKEEKKD